MGIHVLVIDDTRLFREELANSVRRNPWIDRVDTAASVEEALRCVNADRTDVALLNMATHHSGALLHAILSAAPQTRIVALGVSEEEDEVVTYAEAGVAGYLRRQDSLGDLLEVIRSVARGESRCSPRIAGALLRRVATLAAERRSAEVPAHLTAREREIIQLIDDGLSNQEIAHRLCIEVRTVKNHVHNILEKFQVRRRGEAAARMRAARGPSLDGARAGR